MKTKEELKAYARALVDHLPGTWEVSEDGERLVRVGDSLQMHILHDSRGRYTVMSGSYFDRPTQRDVFNLGVLAHGERLPRITVVDTTDPKAAAGHVIRRLLPACAQIARDYFLKHIQANRRERFTVDQKNELKDLFRGTQADARFQIDQPGHVHFSLLSISFEQAKQLAAILKKGA